MADISDQPTLDLPPDEDPRRIAGPPPRLGEAPPTAPGTPPPPLGADIPPASKTSMLPPSAPILRPTSDTDRDVYNQPTVMIEGDSEERVMAWLAEIGTMQHGQLHPLYRAGTRIGRGRQNHIIFPDERLSREHAYVEVETGSGDDLRCWLVDKESRHGTYVNGERLTDRRLLCNNDRIFIGHTDLVFKQLPPARQGA